MPGHLPNGEGAQKKQQKRVCGQFGGKRRMKRAAQVEKQINAAGGQRFRHRPPPQNSQKLHNLGSSINSCWGRPTPTCSWWPRGETWGWGSWSAVGTQGSCTKGERQSDSVLQRHSSTLKINKLNCVQTTTSTPKNLEWWWFTFWTGRKRGNQIIHLCLQSHHRHHHSRGISISKTPTASVQQRNYVCVSLGTGQMMWSKENELNFAN